MTEKRAEYVTVSKEELDDAAAMLGTGWDHTEASVTIEPPRKVSERRGNRFVEVETAAFVKFSTSFKAELADLDEYALKVFIYIGLSISFEDGTAHPGIRKIAEDTGMAQNTVTKAIQELEDKGFLQVWRRDRASSTYKPVRYFSIGRTASPHEADENGELPHEISDLPHENDKLPHEVPVKLHNKNNKIQTLDEKEQEREAATPHPRDIVDGIVDLQLGPKRIQDAIAKHFRLTPNWKTKYGHEWMVWAMEGGRVTPELVERAAGVYRTDKRFNWTAPNLKTIQEHWLELINPEPVLARGKARPEDTEARIAQFLNVNR